MTNDDMTWKRKTLESVRGQVRSLMQPLYNDQAEFRAETNRRMEAALGRVSTLEQRLNTLTESVLFSRWLGTPDVLASRQEAGHWLNWLGLVGEGVEVGVYRGQFSSDLLRTWECARLTSVDPWREFPNEDYIDSCNASQDKHDRNHAETSARLAPFRDRSRIMRTTSAEAAQEFSEGSLDFVYLDAQHHYEAVRDDIRLWHRKVKVGGVIGGHDYLDGRRPSGLYGVKQAVDEFTSEFGYTAIVTREPRWPSWFVRIS